MDYPTLVSPHCRLPDSLWAGLLLAGALPAVRTGRRPPTSTAWSRRSGSPPARRWPKSAPGRGRSRWAWPAWWARRARSSATSSNPRQRQATARAGRAGVVRNVTVIEGARDDTNLPAGLLRRALHAQRLPPRRGSHGDEPQPAGHAGAGRTLGVLDFAPRNGHGIAPTTCAPAGARRLRAGGSRPRAPLVLVVAVKPAS